MFCSVYIIRNTINGKVYIGQTSKPIHKRLQEHKLGRADVRRRSTKLARAMNKYGIDNFYVELLTVAGTQETIDYWESFFIEKFQAIKNGYNIRNGGSHGRHSLESIRKMSDAKKGKLFSEQHKNNLSKSKIGKTNSHLIGNKFWLGRTHSIVTRQLLSSLGVNRKLSEEIKRKISISTTGKPKLGLRKFSEEMKNEIRKEYVGPTTLNQLAQKYDCSVATIHRIIVGRKNGK